MTYSTDTSAETTYENLLDEIIAKARQKGANITSWTQSQNGKTIIHIPDKLPIYYLSMDAAADSLIHQYKLLSEYRYLYQNAPLALKPFATQGSGEPKSSLNAQGLFECDTLINNMDNELSGTVKRKLHYVIEKINSTHRLSPSDFERFQSFLIEHYRQKTAEAPTTQKKKQYQMFIRFLEEISQSDI